ncbi:hypothetical protein [Streptacidiphilus melanogenes]|uniref:hypothetical protein n=1 Tax=Streptacidiphilus melanogenes TaxID=411235 RepID=UPI0005AB1BFC|nr:hypothetical protein [Streptacidiphilus melanogenes]
MAQTYEVERRMSMSLLIREYFDTASAATTYFERQVKISRGLPGVRVEMRECGLPGRRPRLLRRWTSEDGLTIDHPEHAAT